MYVLEVPVQPRPLRAKLHRQMLTQEKMMDFKNYFNVERGPRQIRLVTFIYTGLNHTNERGIKESHSGSIKGRNFKQQDISRMK